MPRYSQAAILLLLFLALPAGLGPLAVDAREAPGGAGGGVLGVGDYAVYVGLLPPIITDEGKVAYITVGADVKVGPWLVEWCVVEDYGDVNIVLVHVYYRLAEHLGAGEGGASIVMSGPEAPVTPHRIVDFDRVFLAVLNESEMAVVDEDLDPIVSWVFLAHPAVYDLASQLGPGGRVTPEKRGLAAPPMIISGFYTAPSPRPWAELRARVVEDAYLALSPLGAIVGPYSVVRVSWGATAASLEAGNLTGLISGEARRLILDALSRPMWGPGGPPLRAFIALARAVYDLSSGLALVYGSMLDPMVFVASGFNLSMAIVFDPSALIASYTDAFASNKTVREELARLGGDPWSLASLSVGLMYLYNSSLADVRVHEYLGLPRVMRAFVDHAVSRSLFAGGCDPAGLDLDGVEFIGGWTWAEVEERLARGGGEAAGAGAVEAASQGYGWDAYLYILAAGVGLAAVSAAAAYAGRRGVASR